MSSSPRRKPFAENWTDLGFWASRRFNRAWVKPEWVSVNLTLKCNLRCPMCRSCKVVPNEMSAAEIERILDQIDAWGVEVFQAIGGEPFVRGEAIEILDHANRKRFQTHVTTNGTRIDAARARALARMERVHLIFSLDGLEEANDWVRGPGVHRAVLGAIDAIREEEARIGGHRKWICLNTIVHDRNFGELVDVARLARAHGCNRIQYLALFDYEGKVGGERANPLWIREENLAAFDRAIDDLADFVESEPGLLVFANSPGDLRLFKAHYRGALEPHHARCYNGWKELYVNSDGETLICDGRLNFAAESLGNVRERPLVDLWRGERARRLRERVLRCQAPCVQDCYLRRDSDELGRIARGLLLSAVGPLVKPRGAV